MDETQKDKVRRFLSDKVMQEAVKSVLQDAFLKNRGDTDVHLLAASKRAIDLLQEGWKDLNKIKKAPKVDKDLTDNIGL